MTGSAIRRTDTETPSPVQVITAEDIKRSGYTTVSDVIRNIAANGAGSLSQSFNFAFAGGASGVAMRGLAVGDTLVLIDGHRTAPYAISDDNQRSFVDVSNLPFEAIDHIEVLRDGASAIYGSDAIAGVVNIILKKTFTGLAVSAEYGETQRGDGATSHATAIYGLGDLEAGGRNGYVALEYRHQNQILVNDRHGLWNANNPAQWTQLGGVDVTPGVVNGLNKGDPTSTLLLSNQGLLQNPNAANLPSGTALTSVYSSLNPNCTYAMLLAGSRCGAYQLKGLQIQPNTENVDLTSKFTTKLGGGWESATELSIWNSKAEQVTFPNTTAFPSGFVGINTTGRVPVLAAGSPFITTVPGTYPGNPYKAPVTAINPLGCPTNTATGNASCAPLIYQFTDLGDAQTHFSSTNYRLLQNLKGAALGWDLEATVGLTYDKIDEIGNNYIDYPNLQTAINNGSYVIGGPNPQSVYNFIAPQENWGASSLLNFVDLKGQRDLMQLPGGPLSMALGAEAYHKALNTQTPSLAAQGFQQGVTATAIGHQNDAGAFLEFDAQVLKQLELNAAVRADHEWTDYEAYGNTVRPHFGFKASPLDILTVRGTWSEGYRLPTPAEAGTAATIFGANAINDPLLCPKDANGNNLNIAGLGYYFPGQCALNPVNVQTTTHNLSPERSDNWTLGLIFEPTRWFYTSVDYFDYKIKNQIWSPFELGGLLQFGQYVRGAPTSALASNGSFEPIPSGIILYKSFPYMNASATTITGFDFEIKLKFDLSELGRVVADLNATHQFKYDITSFGTTWKLAGTQGPSGVSGDTGNPRNRGQMALTWDKGPTEVTLNVNYIGRWATNDPSIGQNAPCNGPIGGVSPSINESPPFALGGIQPNLCYVASWTDFDLYASYRVDKHWSIHGAILNVTDRAPSIDAATYGGGGGGFWSTLETAGAVGRFFSGGVRYEF